MMRMFAVGDVVRYEFEPTTILVLEVFQFTERSEAIVVCPDGSKKRVWPFADEDQFL